MKKAIFLAIVAMTATVANAQCGEKISPSAVDAASMPMLRVGHTANGIVALVETNGYPTAVQFELQTENGTEIAYIEQGLIGSEPIQVSCPLPGFKPGNYHFKVWAINAMGMKEWKSSVQNDVVTVNGKMEKYPRVNVFANGKHNPVTLSGINFDPLNSFPTPGVNNMDYFLGYTGSAAATDQAIIQEGELNSSVHDTTMVKYVTTIPSGQVQFSRSNLPSGLARKYRFGLFDATGGILNWYPSASTNFQTSTIFVAQSSLSQTSYLNCTSAVKTVDIGPLSSNDPNTFIKVFVDTGANPMFNSPYTLTYTMPQFNIGAIGSLLSYSIDVSSLIKWYPHPANVPALYSVKVVMWNSAAWKDSTISSCGILAGINELSAGESFKIFPNPVVDEANMTSTVEGNLKLYDMTGREVADQKVLPEHQLLDHKDILPGVYFYHLVSGKGEATGKLVFLK